MADMTDGGEGGPHREWPSRWWDAYLQLDEAWMAGRLTEARTILDRHRAEFGHLPTAKLAEARQLAFESREAGDDKTVARRARDLVVEAVLPEEADPQLVITALLITFDLGDLRQTGEYVAALAGRSRELAQQDAAALLYVVGCILSHTGRSADAVEQFDAAIEAAPEVALYREARVAAAGGRDAYTEVHRSTPEGIAGSIVGRAWSSSPVLQTSSTGTVPTRYLADEASPDTSER